MEPDDLPGLAVVPRRCVHPVGLHARGDTADGLGYSAMSASQSATVGLENDTGTGSVGGCPTGATSCVVASNWRVRFTPTP